jgi:nitrile hydratase
VREPRLLLREEFGLDIAESREIRVWDSSAELRYMVLPRRPAGSEGLSEAELVPLIPRDALIGVAEVRLPAPAR